MATKQSWLEALVPFFYSFLFGSCVIRSTVQVLAITGPWDGLQILILAEWSYVGPDVSPTVPNLEPFWFLTTVHLYVCAILIGDSTWRNNPGPAAIFAFHDDVTNLLELRSTLSERHPSPPKHRLVLLPNSSKFSTHLSLLICVCHHLSALICTCCRSFLRLYLPLLAADHLYRSYRQSTNGLYECPFDEITPANSRSYR